MFTTILAVVGVLAGLGGLAVGAYANLSVRSALGDCRALVYRLVSDTEGGTDLRAVRDVAVVRYDALEEMSGARSFSLALLNAKGDGVLITSINGRTESRTYAKPVHRGEAADTLSPEEYRALRAARLGQGIGSEEEPAAEGKAPPARTASDGDPGEGGGADTGGENTPVTVIRGGGDGTAPAPRPPV